MRRGLSPLTARFSSAAATSSSLIHGGPEVVVERGCSWSKIGEKVFSHGRTCLAVVGHGDRALDQAQRSLFELRKIGINCAVFTARGAYPTAEGIDEARAMARRVGAMSILGFGVGGAVDTAKATAKLHFTSDKCKDFLKSPGTVMMGEGTHSKPKVPTGDALPLIMVPSSAGAGPWANERCLVWHPEDEVLVPMTAAPGQRKSSSVALVDAELCQHLSTEQTVAMALTALSVCVDAIIASELDFTSSLPGERSKLLRELGTRGIGEVGVGLPRILENGKDMEAREMLASASLYAGQLCDITPAPATQVLTRAAGSLLCRHDYSSVCAAVFPHVVRDMVEQAESFSGDAEVSEAINRALSRAASALLGTDRDAVALVSWLESLQRQKLMRHCSLSDLDSIVTAEEVATNVEMLLAIENDTDAADCVFSWSSALSVAKRAIR